LNVTTAARAGQATGDIRPDSALDADTLARPGTGLFNDPNYLIVPIPISNPTIVRLALAARFCSRRTHNRVFLPRVALRTQGGSWGGGYRELAFDEDRYRAKLSAGYANVIYDFMHRSIAATANKSVSLTQSGYLFRACFKRVCYDLYLEGRPAT